MIFTTQHPDPAWEVALRKRQVCLWIGPSWRDFLGNVCTALPDWLMRYPWATVFVDAPDVPVADVDAFEDLPEGIKLRVLVDEPGPEVFPPNRMPIYMLRGRAGDVAPGHTANPLGMLNRLTMLKR